MIESIIIDYLTQAGFSAFAEVPQDASFPFFVVQKTAGGETEHLRRASVAVQSFGDSMLAAAEANEALIRQMRGLSTLDAIASVDLNSDYNFTDTAERRYRYQAVFDIIYYEQEATT